MMYVWSDMMVFGPVHWLFFIVVVAAVLYPHRPHPQQDRFFPTLVGAGVRTACQSGSALGLSLH
jgi:hypothetical protein